MPDGFIDGATRRTYKLVKKDLRSWIRVLVTPIPVTSPGGTGTPPDPPDARRLVEAGGSGEARACPADAVRPEPDPNRNREPEPTPDSDLGAPDVPPPVIPQSMPPLFSLAPLYLDPFPVVRIRGSVGRRGAHVSLLRVTAPHRATVKIRCTGPRCPVKRRARRPGRLRAFERFLPAGVRITIRVRRQARVGKYVRFKVRAGKAPARRDACVVPGSPRPVTCPPV